VQELIDYLLTGVKPVEVAPELEASAA